MNRRIFSTLCVALFSQAMVALGAPEEVAAKKLPQVLCLSPKFYYGCTFLTMDTLEDDKNGPTG
ncbi:MAG: hypothetical protein K2X47_15000, partial [Bdellovibrionales bacterium]|nr:hypothetical protein [Bdellovibrionales bacterium]